MNDAQVKNVIEAALLAAGRPLAVPELAALFSGSEAPQPRDIRQALSALESDYQGRGIELKEVAGGFRVQIRSDVAEPVSKLWQERPVRYSRALLETLALVAYRQPITRGEIESIRGVAVNPNIIKMLLERNWIRIVGHRDVPGRPELLGTTQEFLNYFSLKQLEELPALSQLKEMEHLRTQLTLPGEAPMVDGPAGSGDVTVSAQALASEAADDDSAGSARAGYTDDTERGGVESHALAAAAVADR